MDRLAVRWNRKLEGDAVAAEYRSARGSQSGSRDLLVPFTVTPDDSSPVPQSDVWRTFHDGFRNLDEEELKREPHNKPEDSQTGIRLTQAPASIWPEDPSPKRSRSQKPGRTPTRPPNFVNTAGKLWLDAKQEGLNGNVTATQLNHIASKLDEQQHVPPAKYLERKCAEELKLFNSKNANSKVGPIQTWSRLIALGDKDHVRGMRRMLSRCAEKLSF